MPYRQHMNILRKTAAAMTTAALLSAPAPARAAERDACPIIVAHRTNMLAAPENTVAGIRSVPAGIGVTELDIQWSSSSFPVLMHDRTVDRTTNGTGAASSLGLGQLMALRANDFSPRPGMPRWDSLPEFTGARTPYVPYGYDFMAAARDKDLDLLMDISGTPTDLGMEKLRIYVNDYFGWTGRTLVMGPPDAVRQMRGWEPALRYMVIEYPSGDSIRSGPWLRSLGAYGYVIPAPAVEPAAVAYWKSFRAPDGNPLKVYTWSSDTAEIDVESTWRRVRDAGVDGLITNEPEAARGVLCS
jgi:glycerophosphoryl diester phosphodiesterase